MKGVQGPFTGRHAATALIAFFAVVVSVNLVMARYASSTFGGVVVDNSYVASQRFNGWLARASAQAKLGWNATTERDRTGRLVLRFSGVVPDRLTVTAVARHPLGRMPDAVLAFHRQPDGRFVSTGSLAPGRWRLRINATDGADIWRKELEIL